MAHPHRRLQFELCQRKRSLHVSGIDFRASFIPIRPAALLVLPMKPEDNGFAEFRSFATTICSSLTASPAVLLSNLP
jgi:hypothetical protein